MKVFMRLLWIVGILVWAACFALGFNYKYGDSITTTVILFVALLGIMGTDIFLLNRFVSPNSGVNRKNARTKEIVCLAVYVIMMVLSLGSVAHYIHVESNVKSNVRQEARNRINDIRRVFADSETSGSYLYHVEEYKGKYEDRLDNEGVKQITKETKLSTFNKDMLGDVLYDETKSGITTILDECESHVNNWVPWNINEYLTTLDNEYIISLEDDKDNNVEKLVERSQEVLSKTFDDNYDESYRYNPNLTKDKLLAPELRGETSYGLLSVVVIVLIQLLVLIPYVREKDWSRSGPKQHKGGFKVYDAKSVRKNSLYDDEDGI